MRISVTDKCNLKCRYCTPVEERYNPFTNDELLSYEELLFIVSVFAEMGVNRVRLTGGEPLVRNNLPYFISELKKLENINEITLTTNGILLSQYAAELAAAGVCRLNISLDSLKPERYDYITRNGGFDKVMEGIDAAIEKGFSPIKVNAVVVRGFNDDEIIDFCEFAAEKNVIVRFIEFMPIGNSPDWSEKMISGAEILDIIRRKYSVKKAEKTPGTGPAQKYVLSGGTEIGIITPISNHFCSECDKLRLTADGKLRMCLLSDEEVSLREAARSKDTSLLKKTIEEALGLKHDKHKIDLGSTNCFHRSMPRIGG